MNAIIIDVLDEIALALLVARYFFAYAMFSVLSASPRRAFG